LFGFAIDGIHDDEKQSGSMRTAHQPTHVAPHAMVYQTKAMVGILAIPRIRPVLGRQCACT
jgi:hypothetical protein